MESRSPCPPPPPVLFVATPRICLAPPDSGDVDISDEAPISHPDHMLIVIFVVNGGRSGVPAEAAIAPSSSSLRLGRHRQAPIPTGSPVLAAADVSGHPHTNVVSLAYAQGTH